MQNSKKRILYFSIIVIIFTLNSCRSPSETIDKTTNVEPVHERQKYPAETELPELFHLSNRISTCERQRLFMTEHLTVADSSISYERKNGKLKGEVLVNMEVLGENMYNSLQCPKKMHRFYINMDCLNEITSLDDRVNLLFHEAGQSLLKALKEESHEQLAITMALINYNCILSFEVSYDNSISDMTLQCVGVGRGN